MAVYPAASIRRELTVRKEPLGWWGGVCKRSSSSGCGRGDESLRGVRDAPDGIKRTSGQWLDIWMRYVPTSGMSTLIRHGHGGSESRYSVVGECARVIYRKRTATDVRKPSSQLALCLWERGRGNYTRAILIRAGGTARA